MRKLAITITAASLAGALPALAEQVVLRVEAQRGAETQAVVDGWAARFPNVVTFPLKGGWTGIGIGPMERAAAEAELARLRSAGQIPGDSFIAPAPADAVAVAGSAQPEAQATATVPVAGNPAAAASTFVPPSGAAVDTGPDARTAAPARAQGGTDAETAPVDATTPAADEAPPAAAEGSAAPEAGGAETTTDAGQNPADPPAATEGQPASAPAAPTDHIRLQRFETREAAGEALARWRKDFPEAGLWEQPDGGFAVTLGPLPRDTADAWLSAFRAAERVGKPAAVLPEAELGATLDAGSPIDLPPPGTAEMPPLKDVQAALRWAGHYDGRIDGKDGPATRAAIAAEVLTLRAAPDAASAMRALIDRRAAWRKEMGLSRLDDPQSGLSVMAPLDRLQFQRNEHGLSIYGPRDDSGAALILYSAPGGRQEMLDFTGLVTALGWVPAPERRIDDGQASLKGRNDTHIGQAEARIVDGRVEGLVLIWPVADEADQPRVAAEMIESLSRTPAPDAAPQPASDAAPAEAVPTDGATAHAD